MTRATRAPAAVVSAALAVAVAVAGSGCSSGHRAPPPKRWVALAPPGYEVGPSYRLGLTAASQSTPVGDRATRSALRRGHFVRGEAQVFTSGADFAVVSEYVFRAPDDAARFLEFEVSALRGLGTVAVFATRDVPGGTTYVLHGPTRSRGREVFCEGVLFDASASVFLVSQCGPHPNSADVVEAVAARVFAATR